MTGVDSALCHIQKNKRNKNLQTPHLLRQNKSNLQTVFRRYMLFKYQTHIRRFSFSGPRKTFGTCIYIYGSCLSLLIPPELHRIPSWSPPSTLGLILKRRCARMTDIGSPEMFIYAGLIFHVSPRGEGLRVIGWSADDDGISSS